MRKTLAQTLLAAFCAILAHAPLEGGGVMLIATRNSFIASSKPTAKSYIQDGLVAMWDGIENGTRFWYFKIDSQIDLIPVRVGSGSTWEGAMLDRLTHKVYRNAGTGNFLYGNDKK